MRQSASVLIVLAVLAGSACAQEAVAAQAAELRGLLRGQIRQGAYLLAMDDDGRLTLFIGNEPVLKDMAIGCGYRGYTTSRNLSDKKVERGTGTARFTARLPGQAVTFEQEISIAGNRVRIALRRTGTWAGDFGWCSFQMQLPMSRYSGTSYRADGLLKPYPLELPADLNIESGVRQLECKPDDPTLNLILESPGGIGLQDMRRWSRQAFQVGVGFPGTQDSQAEIFLTLPTAAPVPAPTVRAPQIGYPQAGPKYAVLEWVKGTPRPDDRARLEAPDGRLVKEGRFGETVDYDFMQSSFAVFDFTEVREAGDYRIVWSGGAKDVRVRPSVFEDRLWEPTLDRFIPWEMCHATVDVGGALPPQPACHMDDGIRVPASFPDLDGFTSYECEGTPYAAGQAIPCALGGWHDAGDYDLNVHAQGFVVWTLSLAYEEFGIKHDTATLDAAKQTFAAGRSDGVPDILQQVEWGALWLLSMQQPDGRSYVGVIEQPGRYTASIAPDKVTDGRPGTGDERNVYVDYHPDMQLVQAISLAAASRVLKQTRPELAERCLQGARKAFDCFRSRPEVYRRTSYSGWQPQHGRDGMVAAAAIELYLTTKDERYVDFLNGMAEAIRNLEVTWPALYETGVGGFWYAPPFLARIYPLLGEGPLKEAALTACRHGVAQQADQSRPRPWPYRWWHFGQWGNTGHCLARVFDAYYLSRVLPDEVRMEDVLPDMYWIYGMHPLSDVVFVCGLGYPEPRYVYNGRLHGLYDGRPASVSGAVVPGIGGLTGGGVLVYDDAPGNYGSNEACIYTAASYVFAVNALKKAGY